MRGLSCRTQTWGDEKSGFHVCRDPWQGPGSEKDHTFLKEGKKPAEDKRRVLQLVRMWLVVAKANWKRTCRKGPVCAELAHRALPMSITRVRGCSPDLGGGSLDRKKAEHGCSWVGGRVNVAGALTRRLTEPPLGSGLS